MPPFAPMPPAAAPPPALNLSPVIAGLWRLREWGLDTPGTVGKIRGVSVDPRAIQFGAKIVF